MRNKANEIKFKINKRFEEVKKLQSELIEMGAEFDMDYYMASLSPDKMTNLGKKFTAYTRLHWACDKLKKGNYILAGLDSGGSVIALNDNTKNVKSMFPKLKRREDMEKLELLMGGNWDDLFLEI